MKKINVGFIGYGNMAQAISSAMVSGTSKYLLKNCINGDLLITMGAGDVYQIGEDLLK